MLIKVDFDTRPERVLKVQLLTSEVSLVLGIKGDESLALRLLVWCALDLDRQDFAVLGADVGQLLVSHLHKILARLLLRFCASS